jgi:hypothetical protein
VVPVDPAQDSPGRAGVFYVGLVDRNFPEIKDDLSIFGPAKRIIAVYKGVKEHYDSHHGPSIEFFYLDDESLDKIVIELINRDEVQDLPSFHRLIDEGNFSIHGKNYRILGAGSRTLDFIFKDSGNGLFVTNYLKGT